MKHVKGYLMVMGLLLLGAVATGVYVWYTIQTMNRDIDRVYQSLEERVEKQRVKAESASSSSVEIVPVTELVSEATNATPPLLSAETITDEQRARLKDLGVDGEAVVITPALIVCATGVVGELRFREIASGSAPNPRELGALLPCLKK